MTSTERSLKDIVEFYAKHLFLLDPVLSYLIQVISSEVLLV